MKTKIFTFVIAAVFFCSNLFAQTAVPMSAICNWAFEVSTGSGTVPGTDGWALFTWETLPNGVIEITIAPHSDNVGTIFENVGFRGAGMGAAAGYGGFSLRDGNDPSIVLATGAAFNNFFTRVTNLAENAQRVRLVPTGAAIPEGAVIRYSAVVEFRTVPVGTGGPGSNMWPTITFPDFVVGSNCTGFAPPALDTPTGLEIVGNVLTFDPVTNATDYLVAIMAGTHVISSISTTATTVNLPTLPVFGTFNVSVRALDNDGIYSSSELSAPVVWDFQPIEEGACLRDLLAGVEMEIVYTHIQGTNNVVWNDATGTLSGSFDAVQAQWGGQTRLNLDNPITFSPEARFITISMRVEVGGEGTTPAGGYLPVRMGLYHSGTAVGGGAPTGIVTSMSPVTLRPDGSPHYLVWENIAIPSGITNFNQLRVFLGWSHANTTFSISEITICEVYFTPPPPPVFVCVEELLEDVQMSAAPTVANPAEAIDWATWNDGVISATMPIATSGPWGLQYRFEFDNVYIDYTYAHRMTMRVEVAGGTFFGGFRFYRGAGGAAAEFNYPGPDATTRRTFAPGVHYVELVRNDFTSAFSMVNRLLIAGGSTAGTTITITDISLCRMEAIPPPPVFSEYCNTFIMPTGAGTAGGDPRAAVYWTWTMLDNGAVAIRIRGQEGYEETTAFRSGPIHGGMGFGNFTLGGMPASLFLTYHFDPDQITLTPLPGITIQHGTEIRFSGLVEYRVTTVPVDGVALHDLFPTMTFVYTYGLVCGTLGRPSNLSYDADTGAFTFVADKIAERNEVIVWLGETALITIPEFTSGDIINLPIVNATYRIEVTSIFEDQSQAASISTTVAIPGEDVSPILDYCNIEIAEGVYVNFVTVGNAVVITIRGAEFGEREMTAYIGDFPLSYFATTTSTATTITITPIAGVTIAHGTPISFEGGFVYVVDGEENEFAVTGFAYTYGTGACPPPVGLCDVRENALVVYPNPATTVLNFTAEMAEVRVFSMLGQQVLTQQNVTSIDVSNLARGLYIVQAVDMNGNRISATVELR